MAEQAALGAGGLQERLERMMILDWEKVAWLTILVLAIVTRLWGLGDRAMSHDESLHTFYSWKLFRGQGYEHDPMMHGPLLFHGTALMFFLFGVNDFTARLLSVAFGIGLVMSPRLVRKWLSPAGALATAAILLASPTVMYYSRYIRHDIPVEVFTVLMFASFFRYLDSRADRWIVVALAAAGGAITTAEMSYINGFVLLLFVALALAVERLGKRSDVLVLTAGAVGLGLLAYYLVARTGAFGDPNVEGSTVATAMQLALALGGLGTIYALSGWMIGRGGNGAPRSRPRSDAPILADFMGHAYFRRFSERTAAAQMLASGLLMLAGGWMLGRFLADRSLQAGAAANLAGAVPPLLMALGAALLILGLGGFAWSALHERVDALLFGLGAVLAVVGVQLAVRVEAGAVYGNLDVRHAMYAVVVGVVLAVYGFLSWVLQDHDERPVAAALGGAPAAAVAAGLAVFAVLYVLLFTTFFTSPREITGFVDSVTYWWEQHDVKRGGQPFYYYAILVPMYEFLPLFLAAAALVVYSVSRRLRLGLGNDGDGDNPSAAARLFVPMLAAWAIANIWLFSWAGEKMPWLVVHLVVPLAFLAGRLVGDLVNAADVEVMRRRGWQLAGVALLALVVGAAWLVGGLGASDADRVATWMVGVPVVAVLGWAVARLASGMDGRQARLAVALALALGLFVVNTRYSLLANFVNDELATEYIVYAHGTPDDKLVYDTLQDMQLRLGPKDPLKIGYDNEVSWPFTWYFRDTDWYDVQYLADNPASVRDHDVVLVGDPNYDKFHPYLRDRYAWVDYRRMWWPNEGYKNLTLDAVVRDITDPEARANWLNILLRREYQKPLTDWYFKADMRLYVKKDLIARLWPLTENRPDWAVGLAASETVSKSVDLPVDTRFKTAGDLPIVAPKDVAVGPDGNIYIVDQGNARIVVLDPDGELVTTFGGQDLRGDDDSPSAWGVGVAPDGAVYVADTWKHRIVKYVSGQKVAQWGTFGQHQTEPKVSLSEFYGPRDVAVDGSGNILVTDTGNSRIVKFDANGKALDSFGGEGIEAGQFREPVAVAVDPATGDIYVADLWNYRIQRFDGDFRPLGQWVVDGWDQNQSADDKAYLAIGPGSTVVASDPAGQRVWVFTSDGELLATLDLPKDEEGLDKPIGVAVDPEGRIIVASHNSGLVTRYEALPAVLEAAGLLPEASPVQPADGQGAEESEAAGAGGGDAGGPEAGGGDEGASSGDGQTSGGEAGQGEAQGAEAGAPAAGAPTAPGASAP